VEAQSPGARILGFVALDHSLVPNAACGAVFGDFLEEIVVRVEEKRNFGIPSRTTILNTRAIAHE